MSLRKAIHSLDFKKVFLFLCLSSAVYAGENIEQIGPFGTLDNTHTSVTIPNSTSQDLLNVDITPQGKSVKKRKGYASAFTLSNSTSAVHGTYIFYDSNGADVVLTFNDRNMNVSVSGGSQVVYFSTGSNGATYQCVDAAGYAYCANTGRTPIIKVNSSTYTLVTSVVSTGTILAVTPERLVMAGFAEAPNRIDFSKANDFSTWAVGGNATDPINFTIVSPGSKITHLTYAHGRIYWFKDSSFGYILPGVTQADWTSRTLNSFIGTLYNTSVFRDDILYFQGNDGHFYAWDGSSLVKLSTNIQTTISQTQGRSSNSWIQSSQADFSNGKTLPQGFISSSVVSGSLMGSSFTFTETSAADFANGTSTNVFVYNNSIVLSTNTRNVINNSFENNGTGLIPPAGWRSTNGTGDVKTLFGGDNCWGSAQDGVNLIKFNGSTGGSNYAVTFAIIDGVSSATLVSTSFNFAANSCSWTQRTLTGNPAYARRYVFIKISGGDMDPGDVFSPGFIYNGGNITFYTGSDIKTGTSKAVALDNIEGGSSTISSGTYTSKSYDTFITTNLVSISSIGVTIASYTPNLTLQTSNNGSIWRSLGSGVASTSTFAGNRYYRYISSFTINVDSMAATSLDDVTLVARATGSYVSEVHNAPSLSAWDSFGVTSQSDGGTLTFFVRSSTGVFYATATANPVWTSITAGAVPSISTNPYFQFGSTFSITAATQNPTISDFTFNWFEGAASDKTYALYHDNGLWWAVASGTGATTNNKIIKYDLLNQGYVIYDIPMNGIYERSQNLYFGGVNAGKIYKFGDTDNDDGSAINAYWKSKDFFGTNPFLDKDYKSLSVFAGSVSNSTMTVTYTVSGTSSTVITVPLYDSTKSFIRHNRNLPLRVGNTINVKFGNNAADQPFEVYGIQIGTNEKPWNAQ